VRNSCALADPQVARVRPLVIRLGLPLYRFSRLPENPLEEKVWLVLLAVVLGGCSSSVIVRTDDSAFLQAQDRLRRVESQIDELEPKAVERALFLQGESFYRYRFAPPPRNFVSHLATTMAVAIEPPMLQALAGSLDLIELRLRACDGAVHLWESLLAHHPRTKLRPLVLYRLGWAYRNTGVSGLPRESGDEAFDQLIREQPHSDLAGLAQKAKLTPSKSKEAATAWSLVPGLGQMYVGEVANGAARLAVALASAAMIVAPALIAYRRRDDLTWGGDWPLLATGVAGVVILSVDYTTAFQDALRGVVEFNERVAADFERRHPEAP
jgi:hypothetical protein